MLTWKHPQSFLSWIAQSHFQKIYFEWKYRPIILGLYFLEGRFEVYCVYQRQRGLIIHLCLLSGLFIQCFCRFGIVHNLLTTQRKPRSYLIYSFRCDLKHLLRVSGKYRLPQHSSAKVLRLRGQGFETTFQWPTGDPSVRSEDEISGGKRSKKV